MVHLRSGNNTRENAPTTSPIAAANPLRFNAQPEQQGERVQTQTSATNSSSAAKSGQTVPPSVTNTKSTRKASTRGQISTPVIAPKKCNRSLSHGLPPTPSSRSRPKPGGTPAKRSNPARSSTSAKASTSGARLRTPAKSAAARARNRSAAADNQTDSPGPVKPLHTASSSTPKARPTAAASSSTTPVEKPALLLTNSQRSRSSPRFQRSESAKGSATPKQFLQRGAGDRRRHILSAEKLKNRRPSLSFNGSRSVSSSDSEDFENIAFGRYEWPRKNLCVDEGCYSSESDDAGSMSAYAINEDGLTSDETYITSSATRQLYKASEVRSEDWSDSERSEQRYELGRHRLRTSRTASISCYETTTNEIGDEPPRNTREYSRNILNKSTSPPVGNPLRLTYIDWSDDPTTEWSDSPSDSSLERDVRGGHESAFKSFGNPYPPILMRNEGYAMKNQYEMPLDYYHCRGSRHDGSDFISPSRTRRTRSRQTSLPSAARLQQGMLPRPKSAQTHSRTKVPPSHHAARVGYWDGTV